MRPLIAAALLLTSSAALAQDAPAGVDAHGFDLVAQDGDLRDSLTVQRPGAMNPLDWWAGGVFEYANAPLVRLVRVPGETELQRENVLANVLALNLSAGVVLHERVRLDVAAPVFLTSTGLGDASNGAAFGDLRLSSMVVLLAPERSDDPLAGGGLGLGIVPWLDLPSGKTDAFLGAGGVAGGVLAAATYELGRLTLTANAGVQVNPDTDLENLKGADQLLWGFSGSYLLQEQTSIGIETHLRTAWEANLNPGANSPGELLVTFRQGLPSDTWITAGFAMGITPGVGSSPFRLFLGGGYGPKNTSRLDPDMDGILGAKDQCPDQPESANGIDDDDGCPDKLPTLTLKLMDGERVVTGTTIVADGPGGRQQLPARADGVAFQAEPESLWRFTAESGACLAADVKKIFPADGGELVLPLERASTASVRLQVIDRRGTPIEGARALWFPDTPGCGPDGVVDLTQDDGVVGVGPGAHTVRVFAPGFAPREKTLSVQKGDEAELQVSLLPAKARIDGGGVALEGRISFARNSPTPSGSSQALLKEIAAAVLASGRTDVLEVAIADDNATLAQDRAEQVAAQLILSGLPEARVKARGYALDQASADLQRARVLFRFL